MISYVYKIRDKNTGKFSTGGEMPRWNVKGKVWNRKSHIASHMLQLTGRYCRENMAFYRNAEIVEYEVKTIECNILLIDQFVDDIKTRRRAKEMKQDQQREAWARKERERQYNELKKEFEV